MVEILLCIVMILPFVALILVHYLELDLPKEPKPDDEST